MKYLCMGYYDPAKHAALTEEERNAMFDECFEYDDHLRASGNSFGGEGLLPEENALTLYWRNGKVATTDGPYAETKEQLGGYFLIDAPDLDAAISWAARCPGAQFGAIEVRPIWEMSPTQGHEQRYEGEAATLS